MSDWIEELNERSKNDHEIIVGSEVRALVGEITRLREDLATQELLKDLAHEAKWEVLTRVVKFKKALQACRDAMDMQEKRETGEFHIPVETAICIWKEAKELADSILDENETSNDDIYQRSGQQRQAPLRPLRSDGNSQENTIGNDLPNVEPVRPSGSVLAANERDGTTLVERCSVPILRQDGERGCGTEEKKIDFIWCDFCKDTGRLSNGASCGACELGCG